MTQSPARRAGRPTGVTVHVVCPGIVATEFHEVQGMDLSALPRMSADDVVTGALAGIALGETVSAPGVEDSSLLEAVFGADLGAFGAQSAQLASRYRSRSNDRRSARAGRPTPPRRRPSTHGVGERAWG